MFTTMAPLWGDPGGGDPSISNVLALMHFNESAGTTNPAASVGSPTITNNDTANNKTTATNPRFGACAWEAPGGGGLQIESVVGSAVPYTFEVFVRFVSFGINGRFFNVATTGAGHILSLTCQGGSLFYYGNNTSLYSTTGSFSLGTWYYLVVAYDGTTVRVQKDGVAVFSSSSVGSTGISSDVARIGLCRSVAAGGADCSAVFDEFRWTHGTDRTAGGTILLPTPTAAFPDS